MMDDDTTPVQLPLDMAEVMMDMAAADTTISNFIHRWLAALNDAFPELTATWTCLYQDMDAVVKYSLVHYTSQAACLGQEPDERGALIVTQENYEFLPGLNAHDLFNQNHVSRATRQSMVSYTQCMYSLVSQWSGAALGAEYEAAASGAASSSGSGGMDQEGCCAEENNNNNMPPQHQYSSSNRYPIDRYADLFNYLLERSVRHETVDTGVPALNAFLATATGQWATVVVVRQMCSVHTDVLFELCLFVEQNLHVNVGDSGVWTQHLLQVLMRKAFGLAQSTVRRTQAWSWFESWSKWFGPGSPVAFVSRAEYQQSGRGIIYPETFAADVRTVLVSAAAGEALASMRLSQTEVVQTFDRVIDAWAREDEASVTTILTQFAEMPSVRAAFHHWAQDMGMPMEVLAAMGGAVGGGVPPPQQQQYGGTTQQPDGRKSQREAIIARCRQRAHAASTGGTVTGSNALAPPQPEDTRSIDDLVAMIGTVKPAAARKNNKTLPPKRKR